MEEVIQKCTNCKQIPDDILMLSCDHDLCLNCAAIIFVSENTEVDARVCKLERLRNLIEDFNI